MGLMRIFRTHVPCTLWRRTVTSAATASQPSTAATAATAATTQRDLYTSGVPAGKPVEKVREPEAWTENRPMRVIGGQLLDQKDTSMDHSKLYDAVSDCGVFNSRRHFKKCLKMMRGMKRVDIACLGPVRVGSSRRKFTVRLTERGRTVYSFYRKQGAAGGADIGEQGGSPGAQDQRGLGDAL